MYFLYILGHLRTTATVAVLDFAFLYSNSNQIRENTFHTRSMKTEPRPRERVHYCTLQFQDHQKELTKLIAIGIPFPFRGTSTVNTVKYCSSLYEHWSEVILCSRLLH